ncbi:hypothetical protein BH10BAC3_BH10BAC3_31100 [soil metagenome]
MKMLCGKGLIVALLFLSSLQLFAQPLDVATCADIVKRSNGNGQASAAAGDFRPQSTQNNPVAPNVTGTIYQPVPFLPSVKTGDIHFKWYSLSSITNVPVISRVWLTASGSTTAVLSNIQFGPPTVVVSAAPNYYVDYAFYNNNLPNTGTLTLEFTDPQTSIPAFRCSYNLQSNGAATSPTINCSPTITTQPANQAICGAITASFSVVASGATAYQWQVSNDGTSFSNITNGGNYSNATSATLSISSPNTYDGKYYRVIVSGTGCPNTTSSIARLSAKPKPTAVFNGSSSLCGTGARSLGIALTGTAPWSITYTIAGAPTTVSNITSNPYYISVSPVATTAYSITSVSDTYCSNSSPSGNVTVTVNAAPTVTPTNASVCIGNSSFQLAYSSTGTPNQYSITAGTRAMPGFVAISNATLAGNPQSITIPTTGISAGIYDFNLTATNSTTGCISSSTPFTLIVNALPVLSASASSSSVCSGTSLTVTAAPANLTSYSWTSSPSASIAAVYNPTVTPTAATTYTVLGTNSNGCTGTASVAVSVIAGPTLSISPSSTTICDGNSVVLTASGGSTYSWSPATALSTTAGESVIASPTTTTTYTVTSQNSSGCPSVGTVTVTVSSPVLAISPSAVTICSGTSTTLSATAGFSSYSWVPATGLSSTTTSSVTATPTATTTYSVIGTTAAGCVVKASSTVTISPAPINTATSVSNYYTFCSTGTSSFNFPVNVTTSVTSMTWSYATTQAGLYTSFSTAVSPTGATLTPSTTGATNATLTVSSFSNGGYGGPKFLRLTIVGSSCTYLYNIQLFDTKGSGASLPAPIATSSTICSGDNTSLTVGTSNSALTVQWQSATALAGTYTNISGATSGTYTTPALTATNYYKTVFSGTGSCGYTSAAATITVGAALTANTITPATNCTNGSSFIALTGSVITGGIFQWQRSTTSATTSFTDLIGATSQNYTLSRNVVPVTTWYRRIASTSTCASNTSTAVVVYAPVNNNTITNSITSFCATAPATTLTGSTPIGGDGTYVYAWQSSTDGTSFTTIGGATSINYTTASQTVSTWYRRVVTSGGCGTSTSTSFVITVNANPTVTISPSAQTLCAGTSVTLTASGASSYAWTGSDLSASTGSSVISTPTQTRSYTVTGTNANGCAATSATATITYTAAPATPTVSSSSTTICSTVSSYNLNSLISSGTGTEWYTAPTPIATYLVATPTAVTQAGTYYVYSKTGSCYSTANAGVTLNISNVSKPVVSGTSFTACAPATANLTALQPIAATGTTLEWHTGNTSGSPVVAAPTTAGTGTYYLFAYSAAGACYGPPSDAVTVTINALPTATVSSSPAAVCYPNTVNLDSYNTTGNGTYTYQWYTVATNPSPATLISIPGAVSTAGNYYLYATSSAGCKGTASGALAVTINSKPTANITAPAAVCAATAFSITTSTDAVSPSYTWQSSSDAGVTYNTLTNTGIYSGTTTATLSISSCTGLDGYQFRYTVTSGAGCATTSSNATVSVDAITTISLNPSDTTVLLNGTATFKVKTSGSPTVNYQWKLSTDGGTIYNNISDGAVYSGTNTSDLVVLSAAGTFNGYKYKCEISNTCTAAILSAAATLSVNSCVTPTVGGSVSGTTTVCSNVNSTSLNLSGQTGTILRWQSSTDNFSTSVSDINNTTSTLTATNLVATTSYRAVVQSGACAGANSNSATISVNPVSVGGSIAGSATVCSGINSTTLTLSGQTGSITKWQSSTAADFSVALTDIANTTTSLTATNLTATTYYRAVVTSGVCSSANSGTGTVTVNPVSVGGTIAGSATVCSGTNSTTLTLSGQTGSITKWQSSTASDFSVALTDIANTTTSLTATNLTVTTYYRAVVTSGVCSSANSGTGTVTVNPVSVGGTIAGSATVCSGTNSTTLTLSGQTGSITKWQASTAADFSVALTDIANTTTSLTATNLSVTTYYRAVVQSGVCSSTNSGTGTVTVNPVSVGGTIAGSATVCSGTNSTTLTLSGQTGSITKWQSSTAADFSVALTDIANTTTSLTATNLSATTYYRAVVQSGVCSPANSSAATVTALPAPAITSEPASSQLIATGNIVTLTVAATGTTSYQWTKNNVDIPGATATSISFSPLTVTDNGDYRIRIINAGCSTTSNVYQVTPSIILYSKATGNVNIASNWGVNADGTGSTPVDFTRDEHTFVIDNRATANTGGNLTIAGTLDLKDGNTVITPSSTLTAGVIKRTGTSGILSGSSTSSIAITGISGATNSNLWFTTGSRVLKNLTVTSVTTTLNTPLSITGGDVANAAGTVTITNGLLATNGNLTLSSNINGTARIAPGASSGNYITGDVIVERYIPQNSNRAWRLLSVPTLGQTIHESWQENQATDVDPGTGYGTIVTSNSANWQTNGYDERTPGNSLLSYVQSNDSWTGVPNTAASIATTGGYFIYIRGDRSVKQSASITAINAATLRTKGALYLGTQPAITIPANKFGLIGNIYPSTLDMRNISASGGSATTSFSVWDPKLIGSYGLGAYQTFTADNGNYIVTPGYGSYGISGSINNTIQSGQAFFAEAIGSDGTIQLTEDAKTSGSTSGVFSPPTTSTSKRLITNLYAVTDTNTNLADGTLQLFDDSFDNNVDGLDARKLYNFGENFYITTHNNDLIVEKRKLLTTNDTIYFSMEALKRKSYQVELIARELDDNTLTAWFEDSYTKASTPVNLSGTTTIKFIVDANAASSVINRFRIVFKQNVVLAVTFANIKAYQQNTNVAVEWNVTNQVNTSSYEIEKSTNGNDFAKAGTKIATTGTGLFNYQLPMAGCKCNARREFLQSYQY